MPSGSSTPPGLTFLAGVPGVVTLPLTYNLSRHPWLEREAMDRAG